MKVIDLPVFDHHQFATAPFLLLLQIQIQTFYFLFVYCLNELKERLIVVWSDFLQHITDTAIDQCRKRLQACVRANDGHLNTFCEQTLANNLHFYVFWVHVWLLSIVSDFYCVDA